MIDNSHLIAYLITSECLEALAARIPELYAYLIILRKVSLCSDYRIRARQVKRRIAKLQLTVTIIYLTIRILVL